VSKVFGSPPKHMVIIIPSQNTKI